ncbi:MAG: hypothetical protein PHO37_12550 [Kiritimatiellae bacterium]|nr:hypothetical protein [Kiritimatiellia bacterium]
MSRAQPNVCQVWLSACWCSGNLNGGLSVEVEFTTNDCVVVNGDIALGATATINVAAQDSEVWQTRRQDEMPLLAWSGAKTGAFSAVAALPAGWKIHELPNRFVLSYNAQGTIILVR